MKPDKEKTLPVYTPSALWGRYLEGSVNGVNFRIPTDRTVEVSEAIARVLADSQSAILQGEAAVAAYRRQGGCRIG